MRMEDCRVGLSIESGSASCASDLSDSQHSSCWDDEVCGVQEAQPNVDPCSRVEDFEEPLMHRSLVLSLESGSLVDLNNCNSVDTGRDVKDLPHTPSFRSRMNRRPDEEEGTPKRRRSRVDTLSSWDDDVRIARHPRAPSLRFCMTVCTLTLVLASLSGGSGHLAKSAGSASTPELTTPRDEVLLPVQSISGGAHRNISSRNMPEGEQKAALPTGDVVVDPHRIQNASRNVRKTRSNLAMARAGESRPVFGAPTEGERLILDDTSKLSTAQEPGSFASNWTSWVAAVALISMLIETGYKEYRQCRMNQEHRRL